jgi:hypothetical protein
MRIRRLLLILGVTTGIAGGCASLPLPVTSGVPETSRPAVEVTCVERLTEISCREGNRCRWVNDFKRADGTYATAHCTAE